MSPSSAGSPSRPPPPECMQRDEYAAADSARLRFHNKSFFSAFHIPQIRRSQADKAKSEARDLSEHTPDWDAPPDNLPPGSQFIHLDDDLDPSLCEDRDVYRWAILYENQRGMTIFSTASYSPMTLLPLDPPPFTIPSASTSPRADQPTVSLAEYPLPDGTWRWVSRAWMIDMRGDGQTQYDGFEYSWSFRSKKWRPAVGPLSAGGLVRRRRWVRLMMRPAKRPAVGDGTASPAAPSPGATRPPSVVLSLDDDDTIGAREIWRGDSDDWQRVHEALRSTGRDGRKLELWAQWLSLPISSSVHRVRGDAELQGKDMSRNHSYGSLMPPEIDGARRTSVAGDAPVPKHYIDLVIRKHGPDILGLFVYPDSRARYLGLLEQVGLSSELNAGLGISESASLQALDFWSYGSRLDGVGGGDSLAGSRRD